MKTNTLEFDAQALREKILDLAMRGKLVPQDSDDEPASVLLKKDGLRESKEKPHEIPKSWSWIVLGSGAKFINGRAYKKSELLNDSSLTPILRVGNLFTNSSYYYSDLKLESNKYIDNGDLIYAWSASFGPQIWNGGHVIYHYHIWKVLPEQSIDKQFLYYFLLDKRNVIGETDLHGSTMKHITKTNMEHLSFPLPPLEEQSRIATKIAQLFALLRKVESSTQQYAKLQTLLKSKVLDLAMRGKLVEQDPHDEPASVLLEKIKAEKEQLIKEKKIKKSKPLPPITDEEKPFKIPDSWEWVRLGRVGIITSGGTPKTKEKKYWEKGDIPWITPAAMSSQDNKILFDNYQIKYINKEGLEHSSAKLISKNSLVVSSRAPIGYVNIVPFDYTTNQGCKSITIFDKRINKEYIYYAIKYAKPQMYKRASGTTFKEISGGKFEQVVVPLPPVKEQLSIARILDYIFNISRKDN